MLGHELGRVDVRTLRSRLGVSSAGLVDQLRGSLTAAEITGLIGPLGRPPEYPEAGQEAAPRLRSPGLLTSHYAPERPVRLNAERPQPGEALLAFGPPPAGVEGTLLNLSESGDLREAAANLFAHLRRLDRPEFGAIAVMAIPEEGLGVAINDRLRRAAAPRSR